MSVPEAQPPPDGSKQQIVFARRTFVAGDISVPAGSHWPDNDPLVEAFPDLFTDDMTFQMMTSPDWEG